MCHVFHRWILNQDKANTLNSSSKEDLVDKVLEHVADGFSRTSFTVWSKGNEEMDLKVTKITIQKKSGKQEFHKTSLDFLLLSFGSFNVYSSYLYSPILNIWNISDILYQWHYVSNMFWELSEGKPNTKALQKLIQMWPSSSQLKFLSWINSETTESTGSTHPSMEWRGTPGWSRGY